MIYQIYPRSFCDSNGDGIGDLAGIASKLDYFQKLGVDALWLSPVYPSPNDDNGYDIADYEAIHPDYGTLEDFESLLAAMKARGLRLIMDQVVNHTSDEHPWFIESRSAKTSPKRDWYHWHPGRPNPAGGRPLPPNNWKAAFEGSAWEWDEETGDYYLHLFSRKQPDLNWTNPEVRDAIFAMLNRWLDRGVDGFRLDVINMLAKAPGWPDVQRSDGDQGGDEFLPLGALSCNQPGIHEMLQEMRERVFAGRDVFTVGETWCVDPSNILDYIDRDKGSLSACFTFYFHYCKSGSEQLGNFRALYDKTRDRAPLTVTLGNHDSRRQLSKFGDPVNHPRESAIVLATWLLTLPAVPFLFQGEELGLTDAVFERIEDYRDIQTLNRYDRLIADGVSPQVALEQVRADSRDSARTPMPWRSEQGGGFSIGEPWIRVPEDHLASSAASAEADHRSIFHAYRQLIALRSTHPCLRVEASFEPVFVCGAVLVFRRSIGSQSLLVILNWSGQEQSWPVTQPESQLLFSSHTTLNQERLRPWETVIFAGMNAHDGTDHR